MRSSSPFGLLEIAYRRGLFTPHDLMGLSLQASGDLQLGQLLVQHRLITGKQLAELREMQHQGYHFCRSCRRAHPLTTSPCPDCSQPLSRFTPGSAVTPTAPTPPGDLTPGTRIQPLEMSDATPPPQPRQGFPILSILGEGENSTVYQVQAPPLDRTMALKVLSPQAVRNPALRRRFHWEGQITGHLEHPHIIPLYQSGNFPHGAPYILYQELRGGTLQDALSREEEGEEWPTRDKVDLFLKICEAVEYAHSQGVIHRNLEPGHIAVDKLGQVYVIGWGQSRCLDESPLSSLVSDPPSDEKGAVIGTPGYLSPELAAGREADEKSDVFSLGALLYHLLGGEPPFTGSRENQLAQTLSPELPISLRKAFPDRSIHRELEAIAAKALAFDPVDRYSEVSELKQDLLRYRRGYGVSVLVDPLWLILWRWAKRHRGVAGTGVAVAVLLIAGAVGWWIKNRYDRLGQIEDHWKEAQLWLENKDALAADNLPRGDIERFLAGEKSLRLHQNAATALDRARKLAPHREDLREKLYQVHRERGRLALETENYLLARLAFLQCRRLSDRDEVDQLLEQIDKRRRAKTRAQLARVEEAMGQVEYVLPQAARWEELVTSLLPLEMEAMEKLVTFLSSDSSLFQRLTVIEVLGRRGDTTTSLSGRDPVEWLVSRLKELDPRRDWVEGERLIWALGRLRDGRAYSPVTEFRRQAGSSSLLSQKTEVPYSWIPLPPGTTPTSAPSWNRRGRAHHQRGRYQKALQCFRRAREIRPRHPDTYVYMGLSWTALGDEKKGEEYYQKALDIDPQCFNALVARSNLLTANKRYHEAIDDLEKAARIRPQSAQVHHNMGYVQFKLGEYREALKHYNKTLKLHPYLVEGYNNRANAYLKLARYDKAMADYEKTIKLDPQHVDGYNNLGFAYLERNQYKRAVAYLTGALELDPTLVRAYLNRANAREKLGDLAGAKADLDQALHLEPNNTKGLNNRANLLGKLGDKKGAQRDRNRLLKLAPENHLGHYNQGNTHMEAKEYALAAKAYTRVIEIKPQFKLAHFNRGTAHLRLGQWKKAVRDFTTATQIDPRFYDGFSLRAQAYLAGGKVQDAYRDYNHLLSLKEDHQGGLLGRAQLLEKMDQFSAALNDIETLVKLQPDSQPYLLQKAYLLTRLGRWNESRETLERAGEIDSTSAYLHYTWGMYHQSRKQWKRALKRYARALKKKPNYPQVLLQRGVIYSRHKKYKQALKDFDRLIEIDPKNAYGYYNRANCYNELGNKRKAANNLKRAYEINPRLPGYEKFRKFIEKYGDD